MNKKAISFVEIIISISIIALLTTIGLSYKNNYDNHKYNTKVTADLASLNNSLNSYKTENGKYPLPGGNINYYKKDSSYSHNNNKAFGVNGFITNDILPKKYLNYLPIDPRTNQFYAYAKTLDNKSFEIAGVLSLKDNKYESSVQGNYNGQELVGLIREYNGPQFIYNKSTQNFPYNPTERLMTAKIGSYSGSVSIIKGTNTYTTDVLSKTLNKGDTIKVNGNGFANIYFSDGSRSTLEKNSTLVLTDMDYKSDNNLLTKIKLTLNNGTIWTKATRLNPNGSEFQVSTSDATAAVRGTIFGVQRKNGQTNIKLKIGKIDILDNSGIILNTLVSDGTSDKLVSYKNNIKLSSSTDFSYTNNEIIYPSNLKLSIESITNDPTGKKIIKFNNNLKSGNLYVNTNAKTCDFSNPKNTKCNIGTTTGNTKIKFCNIISPLKDKSCTKEIEIKNINLVYKKLENKIPNQNKYINNKNYNCKIGLLNGIINKNGKCSKNIDFTKMNNIFITIGNKNYYINDNNNKIILNKGTKTLNDIIKIKWDSITKKIYIYSPSEKIFQSIVYTNIPKIKLIKK